MDSNNILQSLANLRDALQGIESAKQQVSENVAAYEKVRAQLADTSNAVTSIVHEIQTLIKDVQLTQTSFSDNLDNAASQILDELKSKGESISAQSDKLLKELEAKLENVKAGIESAVDSATAQLNELSDNKHLEISSTVSTIDQKLKDAIGHAQKELSAISTDFGHRSEQHLSKVEKSVDSQITALAIGVEANLAKYSEAESKIKDQVQIIKDQVNSFAQSSSELSNKLTAALADSQSKISQDLGSLKASVIGEVQTNKGFLSETITSSASEQMKATTEAQSKIIEQLQASQKDLTDKIEAQSTAILTLVKSNKTLTIVSIVLIIIVMALTFLK